MEPLLDHFVRLVKGSVKRMLNQIPRAYEVTADDCSRAFKIATKVHLTASECLYAFSDLVAGQTLSDRDPGTVLAVYNPVVVLSEAGPSECDDNTMSTLTQFLVAFVIADDEWVETWHSSIPKYLFKKMSADPYLPAEAVRLYMTLPEYAEDLELTPQEFKMRYDLFRCLMTRAISCSDGCGALIMYDHRSWEIVQDNVRPNAAYSCDLAFPFSPVGLGQCSVRMKPLVLISQAPMKAFDFVGVASRDFTTTLQHDLHPMAQYPLRELKVKGKSVATITQDNRVVESTPDFCKEHLDNEVKRKFYTQYVADPFEWRSSLQLLKTIAKENDNFDGGPLPSVDWPFQLNQQALGVIFCLSRLCTNDSMAKERKAILDYLETFYVRALASMKWPCVLHDLWLNLKGRGAHYPPGKSPFTKLEAQAKAAVIEAFGGLSPEDLALRIDAHLPERLH